MTAQSSGTICIRTTLVFLQGFSIPLATAAAAISSDVFTADIINGTTVHSSRSAAGMFCSYMAERICKNSSRIAGKYRKVVDMAMINP